MNEFVAIFLALLKIYQSVDKSRINPSPRPEKVIVSVTPIPVDSETPKPISSSTPLTTPKVTPAPSLPSTFRPLPTFSPTPTLISLPTFVPSKSPCPIFMDTMDNRIYEPCLDQPLPNY